MDTITLSILASVPPEYIINLDSYSTIDGVRQFPVPLDHDYFSVPE